MPTYAESVAREGEHGGAGRRCRKKRMLGCNGRDRGSRFALPRKGADFLCRCDWTTTSWQALTEALFTMSSSLLLQASPGSARSSGSLQRGIVQVAVAGVGCNARRFALAFDYNKQYTRNPVKILPSRPSGRLSGLSRVR